MLSVEAARQFVLAGAAPLGKERVGLAKAGGRILAETIAAPCAQPPFASSAMDGYAVRHADIGSAHSVVKLIGVAAAGHGFSGAVGAGEAVRIFTGAPVPDGADTIVIQEDARPAGAQPANRAPANERQQVEILTTPQKGAYIRPAGLDYAANTVLAEAGTLLEFRQIALIASAHRAAIEVYRQSRIGILATGDELVRPGSPRGPAQIAASSLAGLCALVETLGGVAVDLGIAADNSKDLLTKLEQARTHHVDVLITLGGVSVGDHDLVRTALAQMGMTLDFWKVAMRPGKPLMAGRLGPMRIIGFPGNPVSSLVCALLYLKPLMACLHGRPETATISQPARLGADLPANDRREDYLRASLEMQTDDVAVATPFAIQDSSVLSLLAQAGCLIIRPAFAAPAAADDIVRVIPLAPAD